jgi:hypothetical protein
MAKLCRDDGIGDAPGPVVDEAGTLVVAGRAGQGPPWSLLAY